MAAQSSYNYDPAIGFAGMRADSRPMTCFTGRNNSGSAMPYGRFVVFDSGTGTTEIAVKPPSASGQNVRGVVLYDGAHEGPEAIGPADDAIVSVMSAGTVYMITEQDVTPADPVFMRFAMVTGSGTTPAIGQVRKDVDTADAEARPNCRFVSSALAGGIVAVELNIP